MDGSEVSVVVLGQKGVGKTSFIEHCFVDIPKSARLSTSSRHVAKVAICGREINMKIIENPGRQQLVPAIMTILLFDLTRQESFKDLVDLLTVAQRVSPVALKAVVGTKADLQDSRQVTTQEALDFCKKHSGSALPMPYYETTTQLTNSILLAFQEIMARPLINDFVIKTTTEQEQSIFVYEVMEWAIFNNSANILTHLRDLGYPIPLNIIEKYPEVIRDYLLGEYPLREVPRFKNIVLKELQDVMSWEESLLDDGEENTLTLHDTRPTIKDVINVRLLTHVNLSYNNLTFVLPQFFQMHALESLDISYNQITALPSIDQWNPDSRLQFLNVSHNQLREDSYAAPRVRRGFCSGLWYVDLSFNKLDSFPQFILHLSLRHLDISYNEKIRYLPLELGHMEQLNTLLLCGLSLIDPPFLIQEGPQAIIKYLKLRLSHKVQWNSLRVVVVGPHNSGKTTLISKITGCSPTANKALDVVEWKYKGSDIFSFRSRWITFDMWDFSGEPSLHFLYPSLCCHTSLHVVVCDARSGIHQLVHWLADIQSLSEERVMVTVVFTHMDLIKSREEREKFKKACSQWLGYHSKQGGNGSFSLMATTSIRSLQGEEMLISYDVNPSKDTQELPEVKYPDIPLMPLVLGIHFLSSITGEGIPNFKKTLYRFANGAEQITSLPNCSLIAKDAPYVYSQIEGLLRKLRASCQDYRDGQESAFYTFEELKERLKMPLFQLKITDSDFKDALRFIHQVGLIYVHQCPQDQMLICINPQVIGHLLHRTVQACQVTQEANPASVFLANTHICMMWGVEPILSLERDLEDNISPSVTSSQLLHFLNQLKIFSPLLPGVTLLTPILPDLLPRGCCPDSTSLTPRRSYVLSYLPSFFHIHLISRLVTTVVMETNPPIASSPNQPSPPATTPVVLPSGLELYLWQHNMFICIPKEGIQLWVKVREGDIGLDALPHCGRIDVHITVGISLQKEAQWLRLITGEIDRLLKETYPGLLDSSCPKVEIFVPVIHKSMATEALPLEAKGNGSISEAEGSGSMTEEEGSGLMLEAERSGSISGAEKRGLVPKVERSDSEHRELRKPLYSSDPKPVSTTSPLSHTLATPSSGDSFDTPSSIHNSPSILPSSGPTTIPLAVSPRPIREGSDLSWEVLSKYSASSNNFSILQDQSDPHCDLIPLWECLQESFKTPVVRFDSCRVTLSHIIPDLLFADIPPDLLFRSKVSSPDHYLLSLEDRIFGGVAPPPPEATGMFVQSYYSLDQEDEFVRKPAGVLKAFYLKSCLNLLRKDLYRLQQLRNPHLVAPVGIQYCPPSLALEAAPFGSLHSWMRRLRRRMSRVDIHHIALQILSALEFFHKHKSHYHSINSETVLLWNLEPLVVKLSHTGITHSTDDCKLCTYLKFLPPENSLLESYRFDYMLLGLLVYELATGKRPFDTIYSLSTLVLALLHGKVELNVEADHFLQKQGEEETNGEQCIATGCQRLCLQSSIDHCVLSDPISHQLLEAQFRLCAGDHLWSPMRLLINVEVIISSTDSDLVYWASGSRGLVTGTMEPSTGTLSSNILQEAPPPESGLFANRRCKPVPIAVGRASGLALVEETKQLWVGTENGQMGSVYVFKLPNMRQHHHIHLQDAVLSLCALNRLGHESGGDTMHYRVLVGMANGTIILFLGHYNGKVLENPLQGPKLVIATHQRRPCLAITLTLDGHIWCCCGNTVEVYDITSIKLVRRLTPSQGGGVGGSTRGDVLTLMAVNGKGVWTVGRRSTILRLWDQHTGEFKASYDVSEVLHSSDSDITALAVQGGATWLGTRDGYLFILDSHSMDEGKDPLLGIQKCGKGKVKCIVPLMTLSRATSRLQVICSLEFSDEVSCLLLTWEYFSVSGNKRF